MTCLGNLIINLPSLLAYGTILVITDKVFHAESSRLRVNPNEGVLLGDCPISE